MANASRQVTLDLDWMHDAPWSSGELAAAKRLAEIGKAALGRGEASTRTLLELAPEIEQFLPFEEAPGLEPEMRYRVAARARGILTGEIDPDGD